MKKMFTLVAAVAAALSMNAQVVELDRTGLNAETATAVAAGTVLGSCEAFTVETAFDDEMKVVTLKHEGFCDWQLGGEALNVDTLGIQGSNNPKDADGGNPANACTVPASGSFLVVNAKADGFLYVFHKASSNKQYMVFENEIPVGYDFGMVAEEGANVLSYTIEGNNEYNQITDGRKIAKVEEITEQVTDYKKNGYGVFRVACYADCTYWFLATGSKISASSVAYWPVALSVSAVNLEGTAVEILEGLSVGVENNAAAVKATKTVRNGQVVILKNGVEYNVLGAQL